MPDPALAPERRFIGYALAAVGGLMLGLAGLCSAGVLIATVASIGGSSFRIEDLFGMLLLVGGFGGIPMVIGFLVLRWGLRLTRAPRPSRSEGEA